MRIKKQQEYVRPITTGHVEADMLGQVYLWISERKNRGLSQRPHRTYQRKSKLSGVLKWFQTAPTACWRRLKAWQDKKDARVPKYLSGLRKDKRNGN